MKAVLVLNKIPRDCESCPLLDGNRYCAALQKYAFLNEWVSDAPYYSLKEKGDCPLKPLPEECDEATEIYNAHGEVDCYQLTEYARGYNACLEEITGEKE